MIHTKQKRFFYKIVSGILLSTFLLSPLNAVFADDSAPAASTQSADTVPATPATTTVPTVTPSTDTSTITPATPDSTDSSDQAQVSSTVPVAPTTPQAPVSSYSATGGNAADQATASSAANASHFALSPMTAGAGTGPTQTSDEPQLSQSSQQKLTPQVNNTGALVYSYPLTLPPGRNGMTPNLALQYNSQDQANDSVVGYDWSLSIPYIQVENLHGVDQLYSGTYNNYTTSDHGELGQISGNNYMLRSDDGSFSKYVFNPTSNNWTVTAKNGEVYTYGTTAASRQDDAANTAHVYKWMLDSITDTNGNSISYTYFKDEGQIYPSVVTYTNSGGVNGPFTVTFGHTTATNTISSGYLTGFNVITKYVINTITIAIAGTTRHSYALAYTLSDNQTRSMLNTITETGFDPQGDNKTYAPVTMTYTNSGSKHFTDDTSFAMPTHAVGSNRQDARLGDSGDSTDVWPGGKTGFLIDVNGDGIPDWVESEDPIYASGGSTNGKAYDVYLGTASGGFVYSAAWTAALPTTSTGAPYSLSIEQNNQLIDVNGDGLPDWVITTPGSTINSDTQQVWLNTGTGWTKDPSWTFPSMTVSGTTYGVAIGPSTPIELTAPNNIGPTNYTYYTTLMDVNGDGLPDMVQTTTDNFGSSMTSDHYAVYLDTGTGWVKDTSWTMPVHPNGGTGTYYGSLIEQGTTTSALVDVNGDGLPDFVETNYSPTSNETYDVWMNTGTGWVRSTTWTLPVHTVALPANTTTSAGIPLAFSGVTCNVGLGNSYTCGDRSNALIDVNGDGLPDFVETVSGLNPSNDYDDVWINNGKNGWVQNTTWAMPKYSDEVVGSTPQDIRLGNDGLFSTQIIDVNGDGLPDFVASCDCGTTANSYSPQSAQIYLNTGSGWNGGGWTEPYHSNSTAYTGSVLGYTDWSYSNYAIQHRTAVLQDVNGDGTPDWIESNQFDSPQPNSPNPAIFERYDVWTNPATAPVDLLSSITYDHGASSTFTYAPQTIVDKNATTQTQTVEAVTSSTLNDGNGNVATTSYAYKNGKYFYPTNGTPRKFAGFQEITTTNPDGSNEIDYYHQGNGIDTSTYEYSDSEYEIGKVYRTDITDSSGNLYKRTTTEWTTFPITSVNSNVAFVYPNQTITEDFDGNSTERATAETWAYNTSTGNLTTDTNYGEVTALTPLTYTDIGTDEGITTYTYATNTANTIYLVDEKTTVNQSAVKINESKYYYDSAAFGSLTLGNETIQRQFIIGAADVTVSIKTYNSNGTVATFTDPNGNETINSTYDTYGLYPTKVIDGQGLTSKYTYDYMFGAVVQTTTPANTIYITNYDGMGRILSQMIPDATTGTTVTKATTGYTDNSTGVSIKETVEYTNASLSYLIEDYYDGLGRLVEEKRQTDPNNVWYNYQTTDYWYNPQGELSQQSLPYIDYAGSYDRGNGAATLNTTYTYDPEGRVLTTTNNLGTTTNSYDQWKTTTTDPKSNVKGYYHDAYGNLVQVDEINSGTTYSTYYTYDLNKDILKITDASGNIRNFTYDGIGDVLTAQDIHAPTDTTFSTWTYQYDNTHDISTIITPDGATMYYYYDGDNRITEVEYNSNAMVTYTYDTCTLGKGKLCSTTMLSGSNTTYTYDYDGNITSDNQAIAGSSFLTSYTYDRGGDIVTITYPDNAVVQYNYISNGLLSSVQEKESGGSFSNVISSIGYSPNLQIASLAYGNGDTTTNTYDPTKLYRLTNKLSVNGTPSNIQDDAYTYDADGNLTNLVDSSIQDTAKTVVYTYDNLNRLKTATATAVATGTSPYSETYTYDALGNILTKNGQTYLYQGNTGTSTADPDAATSINGVANTYDANGNLLTNGTLTNTWAWVNTLNKTVVGSVSETYLYDYAGNLVDTNIHLGTNLYTPNKYYSYDGTTKTKQIYIGNQLVGSFQTAGGVMTPWYIMGDNILGTSLATSSTGAVKQVLDYLPFGGIRLNETYSTIDERNKFGGHSYDSNTGLNYMGARYYSAPIGRFISQDPTASYSPQNFLSDPQQLNLYSYARNNPLVNIDPDGKFSIPATSDAAEEFGINFGGGILNSVSNIAQDQLNPLGYITQGINAAESAPSVIQGIVSSVQTFANPNTSDYTRTHIGVTGALTIGTMIATDGDTVEGGIPEVNITDLPSHVQDMISKLENNGFKSVEGYKGGGIFKNSENLLPSQEEGYYKEFDVYPTQSGVNRGAERLVTGQGGEIYHTDTHYGDQSGVPFSKVIK